MSNYYDDWLSYWDQEEAECKKARKVIHEEELEWVRTKQDFKAALLCSPENGFATPGAATISEIPKGWNTGKHSHGEEAMYILQGQGFSVVDDKIYEWETDSCIFIPYGVAHQHFNSGNEPVRYLSAMEVPLERFVKLFKLVQYEEAGPTAKGKLGGFEKAASPVHPEYGRIVLRFKDSPPMTAEEATNIISKNKDEMTLTLPKEMRTAGMPGHRSRKRLIMQGNDFKNKQVHITSELIDDSGTHSGKHAHGEALLYVLRGEGHSIVDGQRLTWKKGSLFHVPGPQTTHQHWNTGKTESSHLRINYGIRNYFQPMFTKKVFPYIYYEFKGSDK